MRFISVAVVLGVLGTFLLTNTSLGREGNQVWEYMEIKSDTWYRMVDERVLHDVYEFRIAVAEEAKAEIEAKRDILNELGAEGWQLVANGREQTKFVFMRQRDNVDGVIRDGNICWCLQRIGRWL